MCDATREWYKLIKCRNCGEEFTLTLQNLTCEPNACAVAGMVQEYIYTCPECHKECDIDSAEIPHEIRARLLDAGAQSI
ncbi:MAG: hypothetical protein V1928_03580 [Parcubacteria group bacterium]